MSVRCGGNAVSSKWMKSADSIEPSSGFEYAETSYPSLTKVAKKITGAHWSGPRFFGPNPTNAMRPTNGGDDG